MRKRDLPPYNTELEDRSTGRIGSYHRNRSRQELDKLCGYDRRPARNQIVLLERGDGGLFLADLKDLSYEPYIETIHVNWGPHSVSYFGEPNLEFWVACPEFPIAKWYGSWNRDGSRKSDGALSDFVGWFEGKYDRNENRDRILGSRTGAARIYWCSVYIERLPEGLDAFILDVETKLAEML